MTTEGLRHYPAVESANGRIKPDWVAIDARKSAILRVRITSSGGLTESGSDCLSARMPRKLKPEAFASRPS
jgi:hypothetical protein